MQQAVLWHLRQAAERYGGDLPLRVTAQLAEAAAAPIASPETTTTPRPPAPPRRPSPPPSHDEPELASEFATLDELRETTANCTRCKLHTGRKNLVFGEGNPNAELMFVGEAPGAREDEQGRPFVGPAGQLLDRIIENAIGMQRADVYIANVNKCRPPGNRNPEPDEVAACLPILKNQIALIRPKLIVAMGRVAAANLLSTTQSVTRLRGQTLRAHGVPVVVTWHPAYLLRNPAAKVETWEDVKRVNRMLGRPEVPGR